MRERTPERAAAELQAAHSLNRMLARVPLQAGDTINLHLTIASRDGEAVAIDRARIRVDEPLAK